MQIAWQNLRIFSCLSYRRNKSFYFIWRISEDQNHWKILVEKFVRHTLLFKKIRMFYLNFILEPSVHEVLVKWIFIRYDKHKRTSAQHFKFIQKWWIVIDHLVIFNICFCKRHAWNFIQRIHWYSSSSYVFCCGKNFVLRWWVTKIMFQHICKLIHFCSS